MNGNDGLVRAGDLVQRLIEEMAPSPTALTFTRLLSNWEDIVGDDTALHVRPQDIIKDTLILESDHPGWTQKMTLMEKAVLDAVNIRYPELNVHKIRVRYAAGDDA